VVGRGAPLQHILGRSSANSAGVSTECQRNVISKLGRRPATIGERKVVIDDKTSVAADP